MVHKTVAVVEVMSVIFIDSSKSIKSGIKLTLPELPATGPLPEVDDGSGLGEGEGLGVSLGVGVGVGVSVGVGVGVSVGVGDGVSVGVGDGVSVGVGVGVGGIK